MGLVLVLPEEKDVPGRSASLKIMECFVFGVGLLTFHRTISPAMTICSAFILFIELLLPNNCSSTL